MGQQGQTSLSVYSMLYLSKRVMAPRTGTLFVGLGDGRVQLWSHHPTGGFIAEFYAVHNFADYVSAMASDSENKFLFTGHNLGYIKIWLIVNFGISTRPEKICVPKLRIMFPFLIFDRFQTRAKRAVKGLTNPMLVSSFRAHTTGCTHIELLEANELIITGGVDKSVRFWTLGGQYVGTLGSYRPWPNIPDDGPPSLIHLVVPPDIKRVASSSTLKVLTDGFCPDRSVVKETEEEVRFRKEMERRTAAHKPYGERIEADEHLLGKHYKIRQHRRDAIDPKIDMSSGTHVRVLSHMKIHKMHKLERPPTPTQVRVARVHRKVREAEDAQERMRLDYVEALRKLEAEKQKSLEETNTSFDY